MIYNVRLNDFREYYFTISSNLSEEDMLEVMEIVGYNFGKNTSKRWEILSIIKEEHFNKRCVDIRKINEVFTLYDFFMSESALGVLVPNVLYISKDQFGRILEEYRLVIKTKSEIEKWKDIERLWLKG